MSRMILLLTILCLALPVGASAENRLALLENAVQSAASLQPGLNSYRVTVHTERIAETIASMTAGMPPDMPRPQVPVVVKYWRRGTPQSLIVAEGDQASPFMQQMVERVSSSLAIEPELLLLPPDKGLQRQRLADLATIRNSETNLAGNLLQRMEILFPSPADIGEAFYGNGLRLPQKDVVKLQFDIDGKSRTIHELTVQTGTGELLLAEFRYQPTAGGMVPERVRVTSPDGKVDDRLEITFTEVDGYLLPAKTVRRLNRPGLQDDLEVIFSDYRINQPFPAEIETHFASPPGNGAKAP